MFKEESKSMHIGARVSTNFYNKIRNCMEKEGFDNLSEFLRYALRKVVEDANKK